MNVLWAFDMSPPIDSGSGVPITLSADNTTDVCFLYLSDTIKLIVEWATGYFTYCQAIHMQLETS